MKNLWDEKLSNECKNELELRSYTSRLLGADKSLVMHGGGNTSVKISETNVLGDTEEILYVKGSGWDLESIEPPGFSPVRLSHLRRLAELHALSDPEMVNELVTHQTRASAPTPSVEAILHAILPHKYVDHTHADPVITITNTRGGEARIRDIFGKSVVIVPYVMPGFDLARLCATLFREQVCADTIGMVLLNHGIFSFGTTAKESYDRMITLVGKAEDYLKQHSAWNVTLGTHHSTNADLKTALAQLRSDISSVAGFPVVVARKSDQNSLGFARHPQLAVISQQGPATPDHVIRTKRLPMIGRDVPAYAEDYRQYFASNAANAKESKTIVDAAPRVVLDPEFGMCAVGRSAKDAAVVSEIYSHTMEIIIRAGALGGYRALPAKDIFDVEYWDLEQAKLRKAGNPPIFTGEIALVTGAASGIGKACVDALLARGAAVVGLDVNPAIGKLHFRPDFLGIECDITDESALRRALVQTVDAYGGLDMLVLNAGIFPEAHALESLDSDEWRRVMQVNVDANMVLLRDSHPLLKLAPRGGRVVIIGSKNVVAPGPGVAAYSASKAALNQLARVAALEWGRDRIRINSLHPNAIFDTGIWTDKVLASRAKHYGLTVEQYKKNNVLQVEITGRDVAELAAELCGPKFAKTTGAHIPVDGGNDRVI
jgi:rhamnose utilization protein RhaD (predicted bifunctional aldolase and dehydrogenase)/NAD(P)-dependent dehydrogenase (short-subunit alcohol dehydrogenase family)